MSENQMLIKDAEIGQKTKQQTEKETWQKTVQKTRQTIGQGTEWLEKKRNTWQ